MSLGGITDYLRANNISIPEDSSAGTYLPYANQGPYEDIMARMRASGSRGGAGGVYGGGGTTGGAGTGGAMGGYDPNLYKRVAAAAPTAGSGVMDEILPRDRGTKGGMTAEQINDPERYVNFSDAQKASYFANNPIRGAIANALEGALGYTTYGMVEKLVAPEYVENKRLIGMGINPTATSEINTGNTAQDPMQRQQLAQQLGLLQTPSDGGFTPVATTSPPTYSPITTTNLPPAPAPPSYVFDGNANVIGVRNSDGTITYSDDGIGGGGGSSGGSQFGIGLSNQSPETRAALKSNLGYGDSNYAKGGPVSMSRLQGPNPAGPDDGYATLKSGEFVINDKAVKKYGIDLMNAINSGKISKGKLRGLLEM